MKKIFKKDSTEFMFFQDYWKFIQEYAEPDNDIDKWFGEVATASEEFSKKFGNSQFARDLARAHVEELERKYKHETIYGMG